MSSTESPKLYLDSEKDELFERGPWPKPFAFNQEVARVFDDMVSRSVPLYHEVLTAAAHWTRSYVQPDTKVIDLGCSTGTYMELLGRFLKAPTHLVGVDNSASMLEKAEEKLKDIAQRHTVSLHCQDASETDFSDSSVVIMNYTLQFLPMDQRPSLLQSIAEGLRPGGLLFLSEKVKSPCPRFQETITHHYEAFKEFNGYARTEIERKKEALEHVLVPYTQRQLTELLYKAGFSQVDILLKMHNFVSFIALK
ncbi:MAG TPA: carboxy-S-adenosyl-L-methionine synthase CmoA [Myxococcales bacterium]|nr:carboxy-S-adenosyl-L-methionine synthase CmoA [Deltaproteobacteria bacterium]MBU51032.1 carboxy-S-adenosyl-L-methionine synthase CmoA [Deltaproteobacteria bacterium]HAA58250.1 carboxy-S-adenosyl-L-methionine synthase CmoA [Myxococcales bacterium]|tara:strand:+ start:1723 stop:2478 length:756 start_codon:yes stop_codon:yes gene_type:complete